MQNMLASQRMNQLPLILLTLAACCGCTGINQPGPVQPPAVKMSVEAHRQNLEGMLYQFELAWLQNGAGYDTQSAFSKVAEPYIDSISDISTLEKLYFSLWSIDPNDHESLQAWSHGIDEFNYYIVRNIARQGTLEAYDSFMRIKQFRCDGAWAGTLRGLEWQYLRSYSQDPRVLQSPCGIFH